MPELYWKDKDKSVKPNVDEPLLIYPFITLELNRYPIIDNIGLENEKIKKAIEDHQKAKIHPKTWENILIQGDNKEIMKSLLKKFEKKINLIYIDPPFATGSDFQSKTFIGETDAFENSKAYSDSWDGGIDEYISFLYDRLALMKELLAENGSIYVHLDWHVSHYIKIVLDEIFGKENFKNEIIWAYPAASAKTRKFFIRSFDTILFYTKSADYTFNDDPNIYMEYSNRVKFALKKDEKGTFYYRGGSHNGKKLSQKVYVSKNGIFPRDVWTDLPYIRANTLEYQAFSTQKPERLLRRIILASSHKNDIVADFFCGTGTSLVVAEKLGRRWIGTDIEPNSIDLCRKRILDVWNSNNLLDWDQKYRQIPNPFKILKINKTRQDSEIDKSFIVEKEQILTQNTLSKQTSFEVEVKKDKNNVSIELIGYSIPYLKFINDSLKKKIESFSDWIDSWAIDFKCQQDYFSTSWLAFRTPKNRELNLTSIKYTYNEIGDYTIAVKVHNILGIEKIQKYEIRID
jgi:DNA modification methylase